MIDPVVVDASIADTTRHPRGLCRGSNGPLAPSRRTLVRSIALLTVAALPTWVADAPSTQNIIMIDGWILLDTDLR
jgi:hypothetical protein